MTTFATGVWAATALLLSLGQTAAVATDLRIVDSQGVELVVTGASIDYGGAFSADMEAEGLRIQQGDGVTLVRWSAVDSIKVFKVDSAKTTYRLEVLMRTGKRRPATLLEKGRMQLIGKTDLGDYAIDLRKVRAIVPVK